MPTVQDRTKRLQSLLRGELSAVETYDVALRKLRDDPAAADLRQLEKDHQEAVDQLMRQIRALGEEPSQSSGPWGTFAKTVEGAATLLGNKPALKALKEGEEHGLKEYEEALEDTTLDPEFKSLIRNTLLPRQRTHIAMLDRLIARI